MSQMDEVKEPPPPPPPSPATTVEGDAVAEEPIYEVEEILKSRRRNGQYQYYLRWKGFDESYNTWEPEENLYSPELLEEFWSKVGHTKKITGTSKPKARKQKEKKTPKVKDEPEKCDSGPSETSKKSTGRKKQAKDGDDDWEEPKVKRMARGTKRKIKDDDLAKEAPVAKKARSNKKTSTAVQADVHNVSAQFVMVGAQGTPAKTNDATQDPVVLQPFRETTNDEPSLLLDLSINSTFSAEPQASSTLHAKDIQCTPSNVLQLPVAKENLPVSKLFKDQHTEASISQRHHENSNSLKSLSPGKNNPKVVEFKIKKKSAVNRSHLGKKGKTNTESDTQQSSTSSGVGNSEPAPYSAAIMEVANLPIFIPSKSMSLASASMLVPITSKSKAPSSEVAIKAPDAVADTDAVEFNTSSTLSHENQTAAASANEMNIGIRLRNRMVLQVNRNCLSEVLPENQMASDPAFPALPLTLNSPKASSSMVQPERQSKRLSEAAGQLQSEGQDEINRHCLSENQIADTDAVPALPPTVNSPNKVSSSVVQPQRKSKRLSEAAGLLQPEGQDKINRDCLPKNQIADTDVDPALPPILNSPKVSSSGVVQPQRQSKRLSEAAGRLLQPEGQDKINTNCLPENQIADTDVDTALPPTFNSPNKASSSTVQPELQGKRILEAASLLLQPEGQDKRVSNTSNNSFLVLPPLRHSKRLADLFNKPPVQIQKPKRVAPKGNPDFFRMMLHRLENIAKDTEDIEAVSFEGDKQHDEHSSHLDSESAVHLSLVEEDMVDFYLEELENSVLPLTPPSQKVLSEDKVMPPELSPADKHAMPGCIAQNLPRNWIGSPPGNPPQLVELDSEELQVPKIVECWGGADMSPLSVEQQLSVTAMPLQTRAWSESNCKTPELITIDDNSSSTASSSSTVEAPDMNCQQTSSAVDPGWMLHEVFSWNHLSYL